MNLSPGLKEKFSYSEILSLYESDENRQNFCICPGQKYPGKEKHFVQRIWSRILMRLFPVLVPVEEDRKGLLDHEMMRKSGLLQIAEGLREREHGLDDSWKELYRWFVKDEQSQETLKQMIEAGFYRKDEPSLGSSSKRTLPGSKACQRNKTGTFCFLCICTFPELRTPPVRTGEICGFEAMDLGNIAHQALERFAHKVEEEGLTGLQCRKRSGSSWLMKV